MLRCTCTHDFGVTVCGDFAVSYDSPRFSVARRSPTPHPIFLPARGKKIEEARSARRKPQRLVVGAVAQVVAILEWWRQHTHAQLYGWHCKIALPRWLVVVENLDGYDFGVPLHSRFWGAQRYPKIAAAGAAQHCSALQNRVAAVAGGFAPAASCDFAPPATK